MNVIRKTVQLPDGREIIIETGKLAKQADGAVMVTLGKTMLLATVCSAQEANPGTDFMPLSVDYKEKFSACGRFPGGFLRREGRPSNYEILISRLVDRALRPLFPDNYHAAHLSGRQIGSELDSVKIFPEMLQAEGRQCDERQDEGPANYIAADVSLAALLYKLFGKTALVFHDDRFGSLFR